MIKNLGFATLLLSLTMLSACGSDRPEWLGGEAKRPAADVRMGAKRSPVLNPPLGAAPTTENMPAMPSPPAIDTHPYDYYGEPDRMPPPPQDERVMRQEQAPRQDFGVDPVYSTETVATAPLPPAPELKPSPEMAAITTEKPAAEEPPVQHSWFSRMRERLSGEPESPQAEKLNAEPYPKLSDVPERPSEFQAVKTEQAGRMDELSTEHAQAQEQRETLSAEPSQTGNGEVLLGHAYDKKLGPAQNAATKTGTVVATMPEPEVAPPVLAAEEAPKAKAKTKTATKAKTTTTKTAAKKKPAEKPVVSASAGNNTPVTQYDLQRQQEQALY